jgi:hypothetical protein
MIYSLFGGRRRGASDGSCGDQTMVKPTSMVGEAVAEKANDLAKCTCAAAPQCPTPQQRSREGRMGRQAAVVLCVLALVAVVVGVDVLFFRNRFWERLIVNVGIVLVFAAFYLRFLKRP